MERLTAKLGPLPLWAWAVIGLAGVGLIWYLSRSGLLASPNASSQGAPATSGINALDGLATTADGLGAIAGRNSNSTSNPPDRRCDNCGKTFPLPALSPAPRGGSLFVNGPSMPVYAPALHPVSR